MRNWLIQGKKYLIVYRFSEPQDGGVAEMCDRWLVRWFYWRLERPPFRAEGDWRIEYWFWRERRPVKLWKPAKIR